MVGRLHEGPDEGPDQQSEKLKVQVTSGLTASLALVLEMLSHQKMSASDSMPPRSNKGLIFLVGSLWGPLSLWAPEGGGLALTGLFRDKGNKLQIWSVYK